MWALPLVAYISIRYKHGMAPNTFWHRSPDGLVHFTSPRQYSIERLPNGFFLLRRYASGLESLHDSLVAAYRSIGTSICESIATSGNDCDQPATVVITADGSTTYVCEYHREGMLSELWAYEPVAVSKESN